MLAAIDRARAQIRTHELDTILARLEGLAAAPAPDAGWNRKRKPRKHPRPVVWHVAEGARPS
jgi:hypothetical protein